MSSGNVRSVAGLTLNDAAASVKLAGKLFLNGGTLDAEADTTTLSGTLEGGSLILSGAT